MVGLQSRQVSVEGRKHNNTAGNCTGVVTKVKLSQRLKLYLLERM